MAITKSAKKAIRVSRRKRVFNLRRRKMLADSVKEFRKLVVAKKTKEAERLLSQAYQAIDKAVKRGVIKANNAARKKPRLVALLRRSS